MDLNRQAYIVALRNVGLADSTLGVNACKIGQGMRKSRPENTETSTNKKQVNYCAILTRRPRTHHRCKDKQQRRETCRWIGQRKTFPAFTGRARCEADCQRVSRPLCPDCSRSCPSRCAMTAASLRPGCPSGRKHSQRPCISAQACEAVEQSQPWRAAIAP